MVGIELQDTPRRETFSPEPTLQHTAISAAFRKRDEGGAFRVASTPDRQMIGARNQDQPFGKYGHMLQVARDRRLGSECRVQSPVGYPVHEVIAGARRQFQTDLQVAAKNVRQYARLPTD